MKKLLLMFALIFIVTSCDDNMSYMEEMTDLQLIEAIANDPNKFDELLDENCTFYSPVVFTPIKGKEMTKMYLMAAGGVFGEGPTKGEESKSKPFKYIKEVIDKNSAVLEFESTIDGIYINGIDLVSWNDEGKITEFKVIVRPLQAVNKLHEQMQNMLEQMKTA